MQNLQIINYGYKSQGKLVGEWDNSDIDSPMLILTEEQIILIYLYKKF